MSASLAPAQTVRYFIEDDATSTPSLHWDAAVARAFNAGAGTVLIAVTDDGSRMGFRKSWLVTREHTLSPLD